jgi:hypothetical protein
METITSAAKSAFESVTGQAADPPREPEDWLRASEVEVMQPDEAAKMYGCQAVAGSVELINSDEIGELIKQMIDHNFDAHQHKYRGTHVSESDRPGAIPIIMLTPR